jgi:hypothetical protein
MNELSPFAALVAASLIAVAPASFRKVSKQNKRATKRRRPSPASNRGRRLA